VPQVVSFLINCKTQHHYAVEAQRAACEQLISVSERNLELVVILEEYAESSRDLVVDMKMHTEQLSVHRPIAAFDVQALLAGK
jgi:succinate dehydrogenase/fumarate reductase-like Fe-S protein